MIFPKGLGRLSNQFTPSFPKNLCAFIGLRRNGSKIIGKIPSILEKAERVWLNKKTGLQKSPIIEQCNKAV